MPLPTVRDLLTEHPAMCVECLVQRTRARSDTVFLQLERLALVPQEGPCAMCVGDALVYSIPR